MLDEATKLSRLLPKKEADYFAKDRRIETVADLLAFWPRRYKTYESDLGRFRIGQYVTVVATVKSATSRPQPRAPRRKMLKVVLTDGRQELDVTFFSAWTPEKELRPGVRAIFAGEIGMYNQRWQLTHPGYSVLDDDDSGERKALIPFYRKVGRLSPWTVAEAVRTVLDVIDVAPEVVPEDVLDARDLLGRLDALRAIHTPDSRAEVEAGQRRMRYEEAFVLQLVLARRRAEQQALTTRGRSAITGGILDAFDARLPFTLTAGQERIGGEIAQQCFGLRAIPAGVDRDRRHRAIADGFGFGRRRLGTFGPGFENRRGRRENRFGFEFRRIERRFIDEERFVFAVFGAENIVHRRRREGGLFACFDEDIAGSEFERIFGPRALAGADFGSLG